MAHAVMLTGRAHATCAMKLTYLHLVSNACTCREQMYMGTHISVILQTKSLETMTIRMGIKMVRIYYRNELKMASVYWIFLHILTRGWGPLPQKLHCVKNKGLHLVGRSLHGSRKAEKESLTLNRQDCVYWLTWHLGNQYHPCGCLSWVSHTMLTNERILMPCGGWKNAQTSHRRKKQEEDDSDFCRGGNDCQTYITFLPIVPLFWSCFSWAQGKLSSIIFQQEIISSFSTTSLQILYH